MNTPVQYTARGSRGIMTASNERCCSHKPGAKIMTKIASFAAIALTAVLVSGFVQFAPIAQALTQTVAADSQNRQDRAHMSASQVVRCTMPPAHQKFCGL
jgi:hypothetical protein